MTQAMLRANIAHGKGKDARDGREKGADNGINTVGVDNSPERNHLGKGDEDEQQQQYPMAPLHSVES